MSLVLTDYDDDLAIVRLNRPERLNAVIPDLFDEFSDALREVRERGSRALVLTGNGRAFCVGGDIRAPLVDLTPPSRRVRRFYTPVMLQLDALDIPIVAAVNGAAIGAGFSFAMAADLRVGSEDTYFKAGFAAVGLSPDTGATFHLSRVLGYARAYEVLLMDQKIDATQAVNWGILNEIVKPDYVVARACEIGHRIAQIPGVAAPLTKELLKKATGGTLAEQLEREAQAFDLSSTNPDRLRAREIRRRELEGEPRKD